MVAGQMLSFPKTIAYFARAESRLFHLAVIEELKQRYDCSVHFYCNGPEQVAFYTNRPEARLFESIEDAGFLMVAATRPVDDVEATVAEAREVERFIGRPISRLTSANRHLGRGFSPGGIYHPRSFTSENATQASLLAAYVKLLNFLRKQFEAKGIELVVNPYKEAAVIANAMNIPYRLMAGSRYHNYHYWAWNEHFENPGFLSRYRELKNSGAEPVSDLARPYDAHLANRKEFFRSRGVLAAIKKSSYRAAQFLYWRYRGYEKGSKGYLARDMIRLPFREFSEFKRLSKITTTTLQDMEGRPFVFFPLHIEPEAALQVISPEYLCQISAITSLARELPAGVSLVVKEAFGMVGRRPRDFYRQILEHKNVVFMRTDQLGVDCVRQSIGVATISGSAGLEASVNGRPVLSFGRHNMYNILESVSVITDELQIKPVLERMCDGAVDEDTIRTEGRRFLDAVVAESFDMGDFDYKDMLSFDRSNVEDALTRLVESVSSDLPRPEPY